MVAVLDGGHSAEGIVGTVLVVVDQETPGYFTDIFQSGEQVLIQHLFSIGAIETFDGC